MRSFAIPPWGLVCVLRHKMFGYQKGSYLQTYVKQYWKHPRFAWNEWPLASLLTTVLVGGSSTEVSVLASFRHIFNFSEILTNLSGTSSICQIYSVFFRDFPNQNVWNVWKVWKNWKKTDETGQKQGCNGKKQSGSNRCFLPFSKKQF